MTQLQNALNRAQAAKCELARAVLDSSGTLRLRAAGWSMLPTVLPGDQLAFDPVEFGSISCGDIVLFSRNRRFLSHRVVSKCGDGRIITQGDASPFPDSPPLAASELLGRVSLVVRSGRPIEPRPELSAAGRLVARVLRRSSSAARIFAGAHRVRRGLREFVFACQS